MTPAEHVAQRTWSTLDQANNLGIRFGEETLTDLLALDMLSYGRAAGFRLWSTTKPAEGLCGADLLVAVRHQTGLWSCLALQAKKLFPEDKYRSINSGSKCTNQLAKLERFARRCHALPLYLLYNHSDTAQRSKHWNCSRCFDVRQLGCTLVPIWHIRHLMSRTRIPRSFDRAHSVDQARPWRCAFDCPDAETSLRQMASYNGHEMASYNGYESAGHARDAWPFQSTEVTWAEELLGISTTELTMKDVKGILSRFETDDRSSSPARVLVVDRSSDL